MTTYHEMVRRVESYLRENPNLEAITVRRAIKKKPRCYTSVNDECYGRMPESCPIVREILARHLPDDDDKQSEIFQEIHDRVTSQFRNALEAALIQKYELLEAMRRATQSFEHAIVQGETELPNQPEKEVRDRSRPVREMDEDDEE